MVITYANPVNVQPVPFANPVTTVGSLAARLSPDRPGLAITATLLWLDPPGPAPASALLSPVQQVRLVQWSP